MAWYSYFTGSNSTFSLILFVVSIAIIVGGLWWLWGNKPPFCYVHILEKIGNNVRDHTFPYKAYIMSVKNEETGQVIKWMQIKELNINWKIPTSNELLSNTQGKRVLHLMWYGGNNLRACPPHFSKYQVTRGQDKKLHISRVDDPVFNILGDDMKHFELFMTKNLQDLHTLDSWWKKLLDKYSTILIVALFCLLMVWMTTDKITKVTMEQRGISLVNEQTSDKLINFVTSYSTQKVDDKTTVISDSDKPG